MPSKADSKPKDAREFVKEVNYRLGQSAPPMLNYQDNGLVEIVSISLARGSEVTLWDSNEGGFDPEAVLDTLRDVLHCGVRMYNNIADTEFTMP